MLPAHHFNRIHQMEDVKALAGVLGIRSGDSARLARILEAMAQTPAAASSERAKAAPSARTGFASCAAA
jgi:hypothetical protein